MVRHKQTTRSHKHNIKLIIWKFDLLIYEIIKILQVRWASERLQSHITLLGFFSNSLFRVTSKKINQNSTVRTLWAGKPLVTDGSQRASNAESDPMSWRHHVLCGILWQLFVLRESDILWPTLHVDDFKYNTPQKLRKRFGLFVWFGIGLILLKIRLTSNQVSSSALLHHTNN